MGDLQGGVGTTPSHEAGRKYARLAVRIRAAMYDSMIFFIAMIVTISSATASESEIAAQTIGVIGILLVVFYEPVMVWAKGGTFGHMICNLRVVDDRTLGNPGFFKATVRFIVKLLLGWFSFLTMMASRRHRAVHDVLVGSTVQLRNIHSVKNYDFAPETSEPIDTSKPSILRRLFAILIYSFASLAIVVLGTVLIDFFDLLSANCINYDRCSNIEDVFLTALSFGWLAGLFVIVAFGWRGRLFGFRTR